MKAAGRSGSPWRLQQPRVLHWDLDSSAEAVRRMRRELDLALDLRNVPGDAHEAVLLVANELAANAVEHVGSRVHVVAVFSGRSVRIGVSDASPDAPRLQPPNPFTRRGRGLQLVDGLASRWSWSAGGGGKGKTVWAEVPTARSVRWY
jgi:anti-sigma regulatory factor (Ser/Thr protein kinase)